MSVENEEGATRICGKCGSTVVRRMTNYSQASGFQNKLQWQNPAGGSHSTSSGDCKSDSAETPTAAKSPPQTQLTKDQIKAKLNDAWEIATDKALEVYRHQGEDKPGSTMILAQVFFKGIVEWTK